MIPGAGASIKEALIHLKRLSDSKRRANALNAVGILLKHGKENKRSEYVKIAEDILDKEYSNYTSNSPAKHSV